MNHDKAVLVDLVAAPAITLTTNNAAASDPNSGSSTAPSLSAPSLSASSLAASPAQMEALAQHMADSYRETVRFWRDHSSLSAQAAHDRAAESAPLPYQHKLMATPPNQVSWAALNSLQGANPELVVQVWERVKQAALNELQSGDRAARIVSQGDFDNLWRHTQFLALRHELGREWHPKNGIEQTLIDQMAQAYSLQLHWTQLLMERSERDCVEERGFGKKWKAPQVSAAQAVEQAAAMAERFQRMFLRAQRALQESRRVSVVVQNAGQVNVGAQQVNLSKSN